MVQGWALQRKLAQHLLLLVLQVQVLLLSCWQKAQRQSAWLRDPPEAGTPQAARSLP